MTSGRGAFRRPSSTSIATAGWISSSATTSATALRRTSTVSASRASPTTAGRAPTAAQPSRLYRNQGRRDVRRRHDCVRARTSVRSGARRLHRRLQRRRLDRHLRRQRRGRRISCGSTSVTAPSSNTALVAGAALGASGERKANMGVDAGDFDADGDEDLFITELIGQGSTLYVNDGTGDVRGAERAHRDPPGQPAVHRFRGGVARRRERRLARSAGGQRRRQPERRRAGAGQATRSRWGSGTSCCATSAGGSRTSPAAPGEAFELVEASRGAAFGDVDNDGDTDVVVANGAGRARLLINEIGQRKHWIGPAARRPGRPARHARRPRRRRSIAIGPVLWRRARADGSYASANDPRVLVGLGDSTEPPRIRVVWPTGETEEWDAVAIDRYTTCSRAGGEADQRVPWTQWEQARRGREARIVLAGCVVVLSACDRASIQTRLRSRRSPCPIFRDYLRQFTSRFEIGSTPSPEPSKTRAHRRPNGRPRTATWDGCSLQRSWATRRKPVFSTRRRSRPRIRRWPYMLGHVVSPDRRAKQGGRVVRAHADAAAGRCAVARLARRDARSTKAASVMPRRLFLKAAAGPTSAAALSGAGRAALARGAINDAVERLTRALAISMAARRRFTIRWNGVSRPRRSGEGRGAPAPPRGGVANLSRSADGGAGRR